MGTQTSKGKKAEGNSGEMYIADCSTVQVASTFELNPARRPVTKKKKQEGENGGEGEDHGGSKNTTKTSSVGDGDEYEGKEPPPYEENPPQHFPALTFQEMEDAPPVNMSILRGRLDPDFLRRLQAAPEFSTAGGEGVTLMNNNNEAEKTSEGNGPHSDEHFKLLGYDKCHDPGHPREHIYHEGYFHGLPTPGTTVAVNPRFGMDHDKPAAPAILRAFLIAFRKLNQELLSQLLKDTGFALAVPEECLFCDIAAQSHYGPGVEITEDGMAGWHFDGPNSLLHMALTVHGTRFLHYSGNGKFYRTKMQEGDLYMTSPFSFNHAVEYPECEWKDRVLAIQVRILFDESAYTSLGMLRREEELSFDAATEVVAKFLANSSSSSRPDGQTDDGVEDEKRRHVLAIPTMSDVQPVLDELLKQVSEREEEEE